MSVRFAQLGARLILWDINQTGNEETAQQVKAVGASVRTYTVDLSNREAIYKAAQQVCEVVNYEDIQKTYIFLKLTFTSYTNQFSENKLWGKL